MSLLNDFHCLMVNERTDCIRDKIQTISVLMMFYKYYVLIDDMRMQGLIKSYVIKLTKE